MPRCWDYFNLDTCKHFVKNRAVVDQLYKRFGILNMFNPRRPNGTYQLELHIYEEKQVLKLLCELAKVEGWQYFSDVQLNGKAVEKMSMDVVKGLPEYGTIVLTYQCPNEKAKADVRDKLG